MRVCAPWGPGLERPRPAPAFSRSLQVTLWGIAAKWGGAKLPGSSVSLPGGLGWGSEACSVPPRPSQQTQVAPQPDLLALAEQLLCGPRRPPGYTHPAPSPQWKNSAPVGHRGSAFLQLPSQGTGSGLEAADPPGGLSLPLSDCGPPPQFPHQ